jgi:hypothetical protein
MIDIKEFKLGQDFSQLRVLAGEYSFVVFGLKTVRVRVWFSAAPHGYCTTQSHFFGAGPRVAMDSTFDSTEQEALRRAMMTFVTLFPSDKQPEEGDPPAWMVENKDF